MNGFKAKMTQEVKSLKNHRLGKEGVTWTRRR